MKKIQMAVILLVVLSNLSMFAPQVKATDLGVWVPKAPMLTPRDDFAVVTFNEKIYVIGGESTGALALASVEVYDPTTNSWTSTTPMPTAKRTCAAAVIGEKIYVFGDGNTTYSYDLTFDMWQETAPMPINLDDFFPIEPNWRTGLIFAVGVVEDKIYVSVSFPDPPEGTPHWMLKYDPWIDEWTQLTPVPAIRSIESFAVYNKRLYAIGGWEPFGLSVIKRVDVYDPSNDNWTLGGISDMPIQRTKSTTAVANGKFYVFGGWNAYTHLSRVDMYDPSSGEWSNLESMPTARTDPSCCVVNGKIYVLGGHDGGSYPNYHWLSANEEFTPPGWIPPLDRKLSVKVYGAHDYLPWENVKVKIAALVADVNTMEPVSDANVTITIYDPEDNLWISDTMTEKLNHGIYLWQSTETVRQIFLHHKKGVYLVHVEASYGDGPTASDILTFHIDPPPEEDTQLPIIIGTTITAIAILAVAILYIIKKQSP